jgi:amidase
MEDFVGAFCRPIGPRLAGAPAGPLAGLRFAAKDLYDIAGSVTGCGNPDWKTTHAPAERTAPAVRACLDAGAELIGKTHTDELAFSLNGENAHYGTPVNVHAEGRIPGGSSSGSAAATAAGLVDFALGTDTGGSVRVPASYCGICGIRPTHGRTDLTGVMPLAPAFDTVGWFTRDPGLLERIGRLMLRGWRVPGPTTRLLNPRDAWALADPAVRAAARAAFERLLGHFGGVVPATVAPEGFDAWLTAFRHLQGREIWHTHQAWIEGTRPNFGPAIRARFDWAAGITDGQVEAAHKLRDTARAHLDALLPDDGTVMVVPTAPFIAPKRGVPFDQQDEMRARVLKLTCIAGLGGLPQVTLPVAQVAGCPIGLSLIGGRGADEKLLRLVAELGPDLVRAAEA